MENLDRFIEAQKGWYTVAYHEMEDGEKHGHWMWFIFPQLKGLGLSSKSKLYGLSGSKEAKAYYRHPILGKRLVEISKVLLTLDSNDPEAVMGSYTDAIKLKSCMTLFDEVTADEVFPHVIDKFFSGDRDIRTLQMLSEEKLGLA